MRVIIFEGLRGGWYWRLVAGNNRTVAIGAEPFPSSRAALRAFWSMRLQLDSAQLLRECTRPRAKTQHRRRA